MKLKNMHVNLSIKNNKKKFTATTQRKTSPIEYEKYAHKAFANNDQIPKYNS